MFLYISLVLLDLSLPSLALSSTPLPSDNRPRPLPSTLRPLWRSLFPFILIHYLDAGLSHMTPRGLSLAELHSFRFPSRFSLVLSRSIHCLSFSDSTYIYPSPALANARQLWPSFLLYCSRMFWATVAPFLALSRLDIDPFATLLSLEDYPSAAARITTRAHRSPSTPQRVLVLGSAA